MGEIWGEGYVALGESGDFVGEMWGEGYVDFGGERRFCWADLDILTGSCI